LTPLATAPVWLRTCGASAGTSPSAPCCSSSSPRRGWRDGS